MIGEKSNLERDDTYPIQGFAPKQIIPVEAGTVLDVTNYLAVRCARPLSYRLNGEGPSALMLGVTVIHNEIKTLAFDEAYNLEVM